MKQLKIILFIVLVLLLIHGLGFAQTTASAKGKTEPVKEVQIKLDSIDLTPIQEKEMIRLEDIEKKFQEDYAKFYKEKMDYVKHALDAKGKDASVYLSDFTHKEKKIILKIAPAK